VNKLITFGKLLQKYRFKCLSKNRRWRGRHSPSQPAGRVGADFPPQMQGSGVKKLKQKNIAAGIELYKKTCYNIIIGFMKQKLYFL
jgi:hypothetical protein